jgi:hypothetical protein
MRGDRSAALDWLDRAYRERDPNLMWVKLDPTTKSLADEPRFKALLRRTKLPKRRARACGHLQLCFAPLSSVARHGP